MKDLTLGYRVELHPRRNARPVNADSKTYDQNIVGTALSWTPDNWTFSFGGGWYQNSPPRKPMCIITLPVTLGD